MDFNIRLKNIRKRNNVTQKAISDHLRIDLRTYRRYEDGSVEPPLTNLMSIANYLNLPIDCLLGNGLFSNWEEILIHQDEIISYLKDNIISSPDRHDLSALTESQLANILPAVFTKITFEGSNMNLYSQVQLNDSSDPIEVHVDES